MGEKIQIIVDETPILLVHTENGIFAYQDRCPHAGAFLSEGSLVNNTITCARHGWQFEANSGNGINPCQKSLKRYTVLVDENEDIWIEI